MMSRLQVTPARTRHSGELDVSGTRWGIWVRCVVEDRSRMNGHHVDVRMSWSDVEDLRAVLTDALIARSEHEEA